MNLVEKECLAAKSFSLKKPNRLKPLRSKIKVQRPNVFGNLDCCAWCATKLNLSEHHIHPIAKGGLDRANNRMPLCIYHHRLLHQSSNAQKK